MDEFEVYLESSQLRELFEQVDNYSAEDFYERYEYDREELSLS